MLFVRVTQMPNFKYGNKNKDLKRFIGINLYIGCNICKKSELQNLLYNYCSRNTLLKYNY